MGRIFDIGRRFLRTLLVGAAIAAGAVLPAMAQNRDLVVFAAASLKNALDDAAQAWRRETGRTIAISYAGSNVLAKQIEAGAPADLFFSADLDWMNDLAAKGLIDADSRVNLLGNSIVLVAAGDDPREFAVQPGFDLAGALKDGRLAMGNVDAVPAGKYGKGALEKLGAWDRVKDRVVQAESVRAALLLVSRGEAPLGIVYRTDAASDPGVRIAGTFPDGSHPPIVYPLARVRASVNPDAKAFLDFLRSPKVRPLFEKQGFTILDKSVSGS
ncbi:molybdate ABC transporter substrate-binding protein [Microvirga rosea]|uniref:molybdate ABC transporter substrate-binding protein n=1 Tax=Microvirga rosea TaxID=2715425 RepID=UPI001D0B13D9|nr:molybdate ABC transporter substrate-binding protein [Microvirga rosea]MCB8821384.1 molybdate ABC transporter substrate-binding protein [Microvirga rosea]